MKNLNERFLKDNQEAQMTLKEFIEYKLFYTNSNRRNYAYYERRTQY